MNKLPIQNRDGCCLRARNNSMLRWARLNFNRVSPRCFVICFATLIITLFIIFYLHQNKHDILIPGYARKSWGSADQVKVFVEKEEAKKLESRIRILCLVLTMKKNRESLALAVNQTWGRRCTKLLFVTLEPLGDLPNLVVNATQGRSHLTAKTMSMFTYAHKHLVNDFDWFMKADDDTYVVMENLRYLLSFHDPSKNTFLGHHFKRYIDQGYMSGGAGFVVSRQGLKTYGERSDLCVSDGWMEDRDFGKCMEQIGVPPYESKDRLGRNSFHPTSLEDYLYWMGYIKQHAVQVKGPINIGPSCCSQLSISLHKLTPEQMYLMEFLLYRMTVFGRHTPDELFRDFFEPKIIPKGNYVEDSVPHFI